MKRRGLMALAMAGGLAIMPVNVFQTSRVAVAAAALSADEAGNIIIQANKITSDLKNTIVSKMNGKQMQKIVVRYSKATDCYVLQMTAGSVKDTMYANYRSTRDKAQLFDVKDGKKAQITDATRMNSMLNNDLFNVLIALDDATIKDITKNAKISGSKKNFTVDMKKASAAMLTKSNSGVTGSTKVKNMAYKFVVKDSKITSIVEKITATNGEEKLSNLKVSYAKQNITPYK